MELPLNECESLGYLDPVGRCAIFGITQVVAQVRNSAVLVHGPKGCAFPAYEVTQWDRVGFNFSEMCEQSVIFGGEELLREKLLETWQDNDAELIGVITTCSSEIIGDDVRGIIVDTKTGAEVLLFDGAGFKRSGEQAANEAMATLISTLAEPAPTDQAINLIAPVGQGPRWKDNAYELVTMLRAIGVETRLLFCDNELRHLREAGRSALTILASPNVGVKAAEALREKCGVPHVRFPAAIGLGRSVNWLKSIAETLGLQVPGGVIEGMADEIRRCYSRGLGRVTTFRPLDELSNLRIAIVGDAVQADGFAAFFREELEAEPGLVLTKRAASDEEADTPFTFSYISDYMTLREMLDRERPDVLLGSDIDLMLCGEHRPRAQLGIAYPSNRVVRFSPRPYWGFQGCLNFTEDLVNQLTYTK